ncbi:hypothetical protein P1X15_07590 [Runella sp. MFBS21]|uniref:hypothetical protein n=1 Tax=Runella sp. MFBS21 TaxID=3034018 RepID=UPI0023F74793|nr:hypothetical protein [Runella sp. MFBS21]MDF7817451.1 hypothetical protein [Runella sp. MFBS21]
MKANIPKLETETYYHIYNRGINGETIFKQEYNYSYFLQKYAYYIAPIGETYAYCLLKNHFHFLIKTRSEDEILSRLGTKSSGRMNDRGASFCISNQFSKLFNGYAQALNKINNRRGGLFEEPFRRIVVDSEAYFTRLIWYIHHNPRKHRLVNDFSIYPHSSYRSVLSNAPTKLEREYVLEWFGGKEAYLLFHQSQVDENAIKHLITEYE